jgi:hypothetical protein
VDSAIAAGMRREIHSTLIFEVIKNSIEIIIYTSSMRMMVVPFVSIVV